MVTDFNTLLSQYDRLVKEDGTPTDFFMRLLQTRQNLITDFQAAIDAILAGNIIAGAGLDGGGSLANGDVTIDANASAILDLISNVRGTVLYRGAAGWAALAPGTSGQFLKTNGVGADPAWAAAGGGGGLYDISMGVPLLSALTNIGPLYSTYTERAGKGLNVANTASVGANSTLLGWTKGKPAGATFHVAALMLPQLGRDNYWRPAMGLYNSGNGRFETIALCIDPGTQGTIELETWSAYNNRTGTSVVNGPYTYGPTWMHVKYDGTNIYYGYSIDGCNPQWSFTRLPATYLVAITDVFFGMFAFNNTARTGQNLTVLCYDENGNARVMGT